MENIGGGGSQTLDGGYIIAGSQKYDTPSNISSMLIKTDSMGISGCYDSTITLTVNTESVSVSNLIPIVSSDTAYIGRFSPEIYRGCELSILCSSVGVEELGVSDLKLEVYPNPTTGKLRITNISELRIEKIEVYNILGEVVKQIPLTPFTKGEIEIDLSNQPNGIYNIVVRGKDFYASEKLILAK